MSAIRRQKEEEVEELKVREFGKSKEDAETLRTQRFTEKGREERG